MKNLFKFLLLPFVALSLASCEKKEDGEPEGEGGEGETIVYTVNETEFDSAVDFHYKNLTYIAVTTGEMEEEGKCEMYLLEDGSLYQKECFGWGEHAFQYIGNDTYRAYSKNSETGVWSTGGTVSREEYIEGHYGDDFGVIGMVGSLSGSFDAFTYNETSHEYTGSVYFEYPGFDLAVTLKFENKNLIKCDFSVSEGDMTGGIEVQVKDHGKTTIDFSAFGAQA